MTEKKRVLTRGLAACSIAVLSLATTAPGAGAAPGGSISGRVLDGTATPVEGICVDTNTGTSTQTGPDGRYTLTGLETGTYAVGFSDCRKGPTLLPLWYLDAGDKTGAEPVEVVDGIETALLDVTLSAGIAVGGSVTDPGGSPVGGVWVNVNSTGSGPSVGTSTAPDGTYVTDPLPPGSYTVHFQPPAPWVQQYWDGALNFDTADPLVLDAADAPVRSGVDAQLTAGATIEGTVTDAAGEPVAGACVDANAPNGSGWDGVGWTQTGKDGTYTLASLPAIEVRVRFSACGTGPYVEQWYDDAPDFDTSTPVHLSAGEVRTAVDAQLLEGRPVTGTVTDGAGTPIPDVNVSVNPMDTGPSGWAQTDADGNYATDGLPPGDYRVQFHSTGDYAGEFWDDRPSWNTATPLSVTAAGGPVEGIDASLELAASLSGTVTDSGGLPAGDVCVVAIVDVDGEYDWLGDATTGADGTYLLDGLPPVETKVLFQDCNGVGPYVPEWWEDQPDVSTATPIALSPGVERSGIDAQLEGAGAITGTVTNTAGEPLEGICAQATTDTFVGGMAGTDSDGRYAILLTRPGDYRVQFVDCSDSPTYAAQWWNGQAGRNTAQVISVEPGEIVNGIDAVLQPGAAGSISGRVTTARGTAMTTACVVAYIPDQFAIFAPVAADGSYLVPDLPSGTYALAFLGCEGEEPTPVVADPTVPGVSYSAAWWQGVPLELVETGDSGPDPIAQGADFVTVQPGQDLTGYDQCFGCDAIAVTAVDVGTREVSVAFAGPHGVQGFSPVGAAAGSGRGPTAAAAPVDAYQISCTGSGGATHEASGSSSPVTVGGLNAGDSYRCQVSAMVNGAVVANSAVFAAAVPAQASAAADGDGTAPGTGPGFAFTGASPLPMAWAGALFVGIGAAIVVTNRPGASRRRRCRGARPIG